MSLPALGEWIEIFKTSLNPFVKKSLPALGEWIEILKVEKDECEKVGLYQHWESGLK